MHEIIIKNILVRDAIKQLDASGKRILFVTDENERIVGSISDGDVRRWILKNGNFNDKVENMMNKNPVVLNVDLKTKAQEVMKKNIIEALPLVDNENRIVDIIFINEFFYKDVSFSHNISTPVIIMAGGKGTRLYPYTKILPKPLIPVGDVSISERILERFCRFGFKDFYFTVNYKKNMIKAYFDELDKNYEIRFIEEEKFLGTAGSLYLLKEKINETFIVTNCDILVEANYIDILKYHKKNGNKITMVTSLKNYTIPYGVIKLNDYGEVIETEEKPEYSHLVNAGFYILEPEVLKDIPDKTFFHITDLINNYLKDGKKVGTYPITENSWLDMGEFKEMERMREKLNVE